MLGYIRNYPRKHLNKEASAFRYSRSFISVLPSQFFIGLGPKGAFLWVACVRPTWNINLAARLVVCPTIGALANINYRTTFVSSLPATIPQYLHSRYRPLIVCIGRYLFLYDKKNVLCVCLHMTDLSTVVQCSGGGNLLYNFVYIKLSIYIFLYRYKFCNFFM